MPPSALERKHPTTLIAEIGENHIGDWKKAREMVVQAARAGADIVKFQSYREADVSESDPEREWFARVELPDELHFELAELARQNGVQFLSTPFTVERARFLCEKLGLQAIKVASSELLNKPLLDYLNGRVRTVYLSTGMSTLEEVRESVERLNRVPETVVMHCVTQYPLKEEDANLRALSTLRDAFPACAIGYSDHTTGLLAPMAAVALGATVIEKHFTLDKTLPGTDHVLSATPEEFARMEKEIRRLEALLGSGQKIPTGAELEIRDQVRNRWRKEAVR